VELLGAKEIWRAAGQRKSVNLQELPQMFACMIGGRLLKLDIGYAEFAQGNIKIPGYMFSAGEYQEGYLSFHGCQSIEELLSMQMTSLNCRELK
jgi:hypothetical protein